ncbi:MAG TPA: hypothetical protein VN797_00775, partial [Gemmatimonadaceae bacterium]|nr:hypothetical protein [Gemmatimonadaceae bacterium]
MAFTIDNGQANPNSFVAPRQVQLTFDGQTTDGTTSNVTVTYSAPDFPDLQLNGQPQVQTQKTLTPVNTTVAHTVTVSGMPG